MSLSLKDDVMKAVKYSKHNQKVYGKWLTTDAYPHKLYCSKCYATALPNIEWKEKYGLSFNYCPNCGAIMSW